MWAFSIPFWSIACSDGAIWYYCTLCNCVKPSTPWETTAGWWNIRKNTSSLWNYSRHRHANEFTSFLAFLELRKTSHTEYLSEIITEDGSKNRRKAEKISVGGKWSDYLLPCHPYGGNNLNQRKFDGNVVTLMVHLFTSLLLVDMNVFASWHIISTHGFALLGNQNCCGVSYPHKISGVEVCDWESG